MSGNQWKAALTRIIEELDNSQYQKMLQFLGIPKGRRMPRKKEQTAQTIIECYGEDESISVINSTMSEIPRNDSAVQDILRPFVEKLQAKTRGEKRKHGADSESGCQNNNAVSDSESSAEESEADDAGNIPDKKEIKIPSWRKPIKHLKTTGTVDGKVITGKVVKKSGLRTYKTKKREKKIFFNLGLADETGCIKVMVYGREKFGDFEEGKYYLFRKAIIERLENEDLMKVTKATTTSKTSQMDVPKNLELEAQMLIYKQSPVCSIKQIQTLEEKTCVTVEGTVAEINKLDHVKIKKKRSKKAVLKFELKDEKDRVMVTLWGDNAKQLKGTSVGDVVKLINVKTCRYNETVSLNSTDFTRIIKVQKAAVQQATMEIIGILKAGKVSTELEAHTSVEVETFTVESPLLAKALQVKLEDDFEETVLKKIPFPVKAEIQGNKILKLQVDM